MLFDGGSGNQFRWRRANVARLLPNVGLVLSLVGRLCSEEIF
jgi:hypothetical protein